MTDDGYYRNPTGMLDAIPDPPPPSRWERFLYSVDYWLPIFLRGAAFGAALGYLQLLAGRACK